MSKKTILITGATDGIGLATATRLAAQGHTLLLHGRDEQKLKSVSQAMAAEFDLMPETYIADLSRFSEISQMADAVIGQHAKLDVLINNAGVFTTSTPTTGDGLDIRFVVNAIAPYLLTRKLLPIMSASGRVINLSSAAQASVDLDAFKGNRRLSDSDAYAQSKLAITMWSRHLAASLGAPGPAIVAVNPGSFLGSKMVEQAYGRAGRDLGIGAEILVGAALSDRFADASGEYFDNDSGHFASPHRDALDEAKCSEVVREIESILET